jgi:hypothetical protein
MLGVLCLDLPVYCARFVLSNRDIAPVFVYRCFWQYVGGGGGGVGGGSTCKYCVVGSLCSQNFIGAR